MANLVGGLVVVNKESDEVEIDKVWDFAILAIKNHLMGRLEFIHFNLWYLFKFLETG